MLLQFSDDIICVPYNFNQFESGHLELVQIPPLKDSVPRDCPAFPLRISVVSSGIPGSAHFCPTCLRTDGSCKFLLKLCDLSEVPWFTNCRKSFYLHLLVFYKGYYEAHQWNPGEEIYRGRSTRILCGVGCVTHSLAFQKDEFVHQLGGSPSLTAGDYGGSIILTWLTKSLAMAI